MELDGLADRHVNRLSTGERARVLTARALAAKSRVLLLDEPLSNLDPYWVLRFIHLFEAAAASGQVVLVALHDLSQLRHFRRALLIADGKIQMDEAPAGMIASERFQEVFRIQPANGSWADQALGGSAIMAVKLASATVLPSTDALPANLHTVARFWTNSTSSWSRQPGSTGERNFAPSIAMK